HTFGCTVGRYNSDFEGYAHTLQYFYRILRNGVVRLAPHHSAFFCVILWIHSYAFTFNVSCTQRAFLIANSRSSLTIQTCPILRNGLVYFLPYRWTKIPSIAKTSSTPSYLAKPSYRGSPKRLIITAFVLVVVAPKGKLKIARRCWANWEVILPSMV